MQINKTMSSSKRGVEGARPDMLNDDTLHASLRLKAHCKGILGKGGTAAQVTVMQSPRNERSNSEAEA